MDRLSVLADAFDHATKVLGAIRAEQLAAPTPCRDWDVGSVAAHMLGVTLNTGRGARGEVLLADPNAVLLASNLDAQFRIAADETLASWTARGMDGEVDIGAGPMPAIVGVSINLIDTATHSWDIAWGTGQDLALPDGLAENVLAVSHGLITEESRKFAGIDPAVAVDANAGPTERLVAFLGRRV